MAKKQRQANLKISVREIDGLYCLMVQSLAGVNPAGWRLQRGGYFPIEQFEFFDEDDAKLAAFKLQKYVDEN